MPIIGNPVGALQEKCVAQKLPFPVYKDMGKQGPDHTPMFTLRVTVKDLVAEGMAGSKQKAKSKAAENMLLLLDDCDRNSSLTGQGKNICKLSQVLPIFQNISFSFCYLNTDRVQCLALFTKKNYMVFPCRSSHHSSMVSMAACYRGRPGIKSRQGRDLINF